MAGMAEPIVTGLPKPAPWRGMRTRSAAWALLPLS